MFDLSPIRASVVFYISSDKVEVEFHTITHVGLHLVIKVIVLQEHVVNDRLEKPVVDIFKDRGVLQK